MRVAAGATRRGGPVPHLRCSGWNSVLPSPYGLGQLVARLRRSGIVGVARRPQSRILAKEMRWRRDASWIRGGWNVAQLCAECGACGV